MLSEKKTQEKVLEKMISPEVFCDIRRVQNRDEMKGTSPVSSDQGLISVELKTTTTQTVQ